MTPDNKAQERPPKDPPNQIMTDRLRLTALLDLIEDRGISRDAVCKALGWPEADLDLALAGTDPEKTRQSYDSLSRFAHKAMSSQLMRLLDLIEDERIERATVRNQLGCSADDLVLALAGACPARANQYYTQLRQFARTACVPKKAAEAENWEPYGFEDWLVKRPHEYRVQNAVFIYLLKQLALRGVNAAAVGKYLKRRQQELREELGDETYQLGHSEAHMCFLRKGTHKATADTTLEVARLFISHLGKLKEHDSRLPRSLTGTGGPLTAADAWVTGPGIAQAVYLGSAQDRGAEIDDDTKADTVAAIGCAVFTAFTGQPCEPPNPQPNIGLASTILVGDELIITKVNRPKSQPPTLAEDEDEWLKVQIHEYQLVSKYFAGLAAALEKRMGQHRLTRQPDRKTIFDTFGGVNR